MGVEKPNSIVSRVDEENVPTELLTEHAENVASRACWLTSAEDDANESTEQKHVRSIGWLHDAGKATPAFQRYIRNQRRQGKETYHARLGAFAVAHVFDELGAEDRELLAAWAAVMKHHGQLPDLASKTVDVIGAELREENSAYVGKQLRSIAQHAPSRSVLDELLTEASEGMTNWDRFHDEMENGSVHGNLARAVGIDGHRPPRAGQANPQAVPKRTYDRAIRFWSTLTLADKTVASGSIERSDLLPTTLPIDPLDQHVDHELAESGVSQTRINDAADGSMRIHDETSLNALREAARRRVREAAPRLVESEVGILTLPTGLGKTFSGITGAFALRDERRRQLDLDSTPRVIYALPYTSIIEQTRDVFETEVFEADPTGRAFTTHHYLTETVTYTNSENGGGSKPDTDQTASRAKLLGESWRSGVVLTTFVQLVESLAGPSNGAGLKLSALNHAIIVLDEPQAIPKPWWGAVRRLSRTLIDEFDVRIVSMTATQPTLFTEDEFQTTSLLSRTSSPGQNESSFERSAYRSVARVRYYVDDSVGTLTANASGDPISHQRAATRLVHRATSSESSGFGTSVLSVCSTVASSRQLTEYVCKRAKTANKNVKKVGDVYQTVLCDTDTDPSRSPPNPRTLTEATMEQLGFDQEDDGTWVGDSVGSETVLVGTFNARYRPFDRRVLVRIADELSTADVPFVFISTQAIEAGVDISFHHVYRDVAPLDSIVQAAGRCNRSFEWGIEGGSATVWCLDAIDPETDSTLPTQYIYREAEHLDRIASLLIDASPRDGEGISASTMELETVQEFFDFVEEQGFTNDELREWVNACEAERLGRCSLLGDEYETVDFLVAVSDADDRRLAMLRNRFDEFEGKGYERLEELADMRVSVSVRDADQLRLHSPVDGSSRHDPDVNVFSHPVGHGNATYDLAAGGFLVEEDSVVNRFS